MLLVPGGEHVVGHRRAIVENIIEQLQNPAIAGYAVILPMLFLVNFLILWVP